MPHAARRLDHDFAVGGFAGEPARSSEVHGPVASMHREIEERLLLGTDRLALIPLLVRPGEAMIAASSRFAGWAVLTGGLCATFLVAFH